MEAEVDIDYVRRGWRIRQSNYTICEKEKEAWLSSKYESEASQASKKRPFGI